MGRHQRLVLGRADPHFRVECFRRRALYERVRLSRFCSSRVGCELLVARSIMKDRHKLERQEGKAKEGAVRLVLGMLDKADAIL